MKHKMYTPNKPKLEEITKQVTKDGEMTKPTYEEEAKRLAVRLNEMVGTDEQIAILLIRKELQNFATFILSSQRDYYKRKVKKMKIPENLEMGGPTPKQAFNHALDKVVALLSKKICSWDSCNQPVDVVYEGRGYCEKHGEEHLISEGGNSS